MSLGKLANWVRATSAAGLLTAALLAGCRSAEQKALDQAKLQASATNIPQQVQFIDGNGDTVTTVVQPPLPGQTQQVQTSITPPAPGPPPHRTRPVVSALGAPASVAAMPSPEPGYAEPTNAPAAAPQGSEAFSSLPATTTATTPSPSPATAPAVNLSVPAGTELAVRMNQRIDVKHAAPGESFSGEIVQPVERGGALVIPRGTHVRGRIDAAHRRGHFKGRSLLELRLTSITLNGREYELDTHDTVRTKKGKGRRSAGFIGGLTGAGMLIGGIASGGVGLAIGAASGAGAGTLLAGVTGNRDIVIPAESVVHFRLADQLVVQTP